MNFERDVLSLALDSHGPEYADEMVRHRKLLQAVLLQGYQDLCEEMRTPRGYGYQCGCPFGEENHPPTGKCPQGLYFHHLPAREWIDECSMEPWGFGWVCTKLLIDPERCQEAMLAAAEHATNSLNPTLPVM
jgi:hypothetical protein